MWLTIRTKIVDNKNFLIFDIPQILFKSKYLLIQTFHDTSLLPSPQKLLSEILVINNSKCQQDAYYCKLRSLQCTSILLYLFVWSLQNSPCGVLISLFHSFSKCIPFRQISQAFLFNPIQTMNNISTLLWLLWLVSGYIHVYCGQTPHIIQCHGEICRS